jgi:hypothetical protein
MQAATGNEPRSNTRTPAPAPVNFGVYRGLRLSAFRRALLCITCSVADRLSRFGTDNVRLAV